MGQDKSRLEPPRLSKEQRARVYDNACERIRKLYFDPKFRGTDWSALVQTHRERVLACSAPDEFESAIHDVVRSLGTSHTGFFHQSVKRVPGRLAIGATCVKMETRTGAQWVVRDVHKGGPADTAGLLPCDVILSIDGKFVHPPGQPMFPMGRVSTIVVARDGKERSIPIDVPTPRSRKQPYSEPSAVVHSTLSALIGYIKVSILPGLLGIDVSREIDSAFRALSSCDRLILDLRGHLGGGLAVLRLMSHLTPDQIPIGYTVTRKRAERGYTKERLPRLDRLPGTKLWGIASMALKYAWRDPSVVLVSEGLGAKRCHGRIVILANEGTVSAGEMVCAFARERHLATIVGTETAGRLIPGSGFKVGYGYMVIFPKAAYITWAGEMYEGRGIAPDVFVPWSVNAYREGRDNQLEKAIEVVSGL